MGSKIYVGGLPYAATEPQLNDLFTPHGTVESARVIMDKFTGQSRGFGFVEMATAQGRRLRKSQVQSKPSRPFEKALRCETEPRVGASWHRAAVEMIPGHPGERVRPDRRQSRY